MFAKKPSNGSVEMAKETEAPQPKGDNVISIIGPGMRVVGDCETDGTLRIEGVVEGTVRAAKAVVIGKDGMVKGDVLTQDAIIGGRVNGTVQTGELKQQPAPAPQLPPPQVQVKPVPIGLGF